MFQIMQNAKQMKATVRICMYLNKTNDWALVHENGFSLEKVLVHIEAYPRSKNDPTEKFKVFSFSTL